MKKKKGEKGKQQEHYTQQCAHKRQGGEKQQGSHRGNNNQAIAPDLEDIEQLIEAWRQQYTPTTIGEEGEEAEGQMQKRQKTEAEMMTNQQTQEPQHRKQQTNKQKQVEEDEAPEKQKDQQQSRSASGNKRRKMDEAKQTEMGEEGQYADRIPDALERLLGEFTDAHENNEKLRNMEKCHWGIPIKTDIHNIQKETSGKATQ